ncbi:MAG: TetR/AcrR family transcriptional regulator [Phaeodactylibacter sp.]|nr:TetR/AcrR family transcriptional regulator [Phaeodactylibacter sp.]MCB9272396.1 TetR/AcrR family transcriptional regulator [Lewinellaceae bacterium]
MTLFSIELSINDKLYQRDPQRTELGRKILKHSILLLDELGLEHFNFRKLAERIGSAEASIYRYFENKHLLLLYLFNWYWEWMRFHIDMKAMNIRCPKEKLRMMISCIVDTARRNARIEFIDEDVLHRIVVAEGAKAYHNKGVDAQNEEGLFHAYKSLCNRIASVILENNPDFPYPRALASSLLEMANKHIYFAEHLPLLTEASNEGNVLQQVERFLVFFAWRLIFPHEGILE